MSVDFEAEHPRAQSGQFRDKDQAPSSATFPQTAAVQPSESRTVKTVTSGNGVPFVVRVVEPGDTYGATNSLTAKKTMVEFFDARYPHTENGQFISRYYLETLRGDDGYGSPHRPGMGLVLDGGAPDWMIDGAAMDELHEWLDTNHPSSLGSETPAERDAELWTAHTRNLTEGLASRIADLSDDVHSIEVHVDDGGDIETVMFLDDEEDEADLGDSYGNLASEVKAVITPKVVETLANEGHIRIDVPRPPAPRASLPENLLRDIP